jgi:hypothetical protein
VCEKHRNPRRSMFEKREKIFFLLISTLLSEEKRGFVDPIKIVPLK